MILVVAVLLISGCADHGGPRLDSATPSSAPSDAMVMLTGSGLCGTDGDCSTAAGQIQVGTSAPIVEAQIVSYADTSALIIVPEGVPVGETTLVVTVNDDSSNGLAFEVLP